MKKLLTVLHGFLVGLCDLIPGISGGTMAFILGIYERLITFIKNISLDTIAVWDKKRFRKGIKNLDLGFTIPFFSGILLALFLLANLMDHILTTFPIYTYAFFFGLIAASSFIIASHIRGWTRKRVTFLSVGFCIGLIASFVTGLMLPHTGLVLFISGFIAAAAMLLPGVSGSYILLILGQYEHITGALRTFDFSTLIIVAIGVLLGLYAMSHLISYLLKHQHQLTIFFLLGLVLGSLYIFIGKIGYNWSVISILWFVIGLVLPLAIDFFGKSRKRK